MLNAKCFEEQWNVYKDWTVYNKYGHRDEHGYTRTGLTVAQAVFCLASEQTHITQTRLRVLRVSERSCAGQLFTHGVVVLQGIFTS